MISLVSKMLPIDEMLNCLYLEHKWDIDFQTFNFYYD